MMHKHDETPDRTFEWAPQPAAFDFIRRILGACLTACPEAAAFAERMRMETGTRLIDWIDHIRLSERDPLVDGIGEAGFGAVNRAGGERIFTNGNGMFPPILVWDGITEIGIKVESVADFLAANQLQREIEGNPLAGLRTSRIYPGRNCAMTIVERHGTRALAAAGTGPDYPIKRLQHLERFRFRPREFADEAEGFEITNQLIDRAVSDLGRDLASDLWFAAEREYWMRRNHAARVQKSRQDRLGLGWANHDHHTYRSSRKNFRHLVAAWEKLGLRCRERFYAGKEAGWGAQVMEQPITGIITFNDVDLTPEELMGDFSHEGLPETTGLGTVGLWCALHGDSFFQSGMHHLEAMFDFDSLAKQLAEEAGIKTMKPFTDFPYLRQAFTEGERWEVRADRIERLLLAGLITQEQAEVFLSRGAIGSHLENLERNDGFKGFNQEGVNAIITATDPRRNIGA